MAVFGAGLRFRCHQLLLGGLFGPCAANGPSACVPRDVFPAIERRHLSRVMVTGRVDVWMSVVGHGSEARPSVRRVTSRSVGAVFGGIMRAGVDLDLPLVFWAPVRLRTLSHIVHAGTGAGSPITMLLWTVKWKLWAG
jgi:hypothetical protein